MIRVPVDESLDVNLSRCTVGGILRSDTSRLPRLVDLHVNPVHVTSRAGPRAHISRAGYVEESITKDPVCVSRAISRLRVVNQDYIVDFNESGARRRTVSARRRGRPPIGYSGLEATPIKRRSAIRVGLTAYYFLDGCNYGGALDRRIPRTRRHHYWCCSHNHHNYQHY